MIPKFAHLPCPAGIIAVTCTGMQAHFLQSLAATLQIALHNKCRELFEFCYFGFERGFLLSGEVCSSEHVCNTTCYFT